MKCDTSLELALQTECNDDDDNNNNDKIIYLSSIKYNTLLESAAQTESDDDDVNNNNNKSGKQSLNSIFLFLAAKAALYLGSSRTDSLTHQSRFGADYGRAIGHNSVIFQARTSKFCMEVNLYNTYPRPFFRLILCQVT